MPWNLKQVLSVFQKDTNYRFFRGSKHGLERECLRINPDGSLAMTPHPKNLGAALKNPYITTDFCEAQLELITPPQNSEQQALDYLKNIHLFVNKNLPYEWLWPLSMPCHLPKEDKIPIGQYGRSPQGQKRTLYRIGLAHRYGRKMQTVSGTHYNFSFSEDFWKFFHKKFAPKHRLQDFINSSYLHMVRNFLRYGWLNTYLFGAAPAVCRSYVKKKPKYLKRFRLNTFYAPYGTSLRMSGLGYYSRVQGQLVISFNDIKSYLSDLKYAISTPSPKYKGLPGINDHILQLENEHYSRIRPKTLLEENETPLQAMEKRGIKYLEVRAVDINPYESTGLAKEQLSFLHTFLVYCLFEESELLDQASNRVFTGNQEKVATFGRDPKLTLTHQGKEIPLKKYAEKILVQLEPIAALMDKTFKTDHYSKSLSWQQQKVEDPNLTPSAKILQEMQLRKESASKFGLRLAQRHHQYFEATPVNKKIEQSLAQTAEKSLIDQERLEITYDYLLYGYEDLELSSQMLIKEAFKRNITVDMLDRQANFYRLTKGKKSECIRQATKTSRDSYVASEIMGNKFVSKQILQEHGLNVPKGKKYPEITEALKAYELYSKLKVVVKPTTTNYGLGIDFVNPGNQRSFEEAVHQAFSHDDSIIIEEFIPGQEYRFLVIDRKVISVLKRIPANIVGDGKHNIKELIEIKNADYRRFKPRRSRIQMGLVEKKNIQEQKLSFKSIPKKGQQIFLRKNSNIGTGGDPIDVTEQIPDHFKVASIKAAQAVGGKICGIDMIINDHQYAIIETNYNPSLSIHEALYEGLPKNTPKAVLDYLGF